MSNIDDKYDLAIHVYRVKWAQAYAQQVEINFYLIDSQPYYVALLFDFLKLMLVTWCIFSLFS